MISIWLQFIICTAIILASGKRVAKYGDVIAEKTGLGGIWTGVMLVALVTSLPEVFTGVGSVIFVDAPNLSAGNLFGANSYNLLNIAILDLLHKGTPLLSSVSAGLLLTAKLSLFPLSIALAGIFLSSKLPPYNFANISLYSFLILFAYIISARIIFKSEKKQQETIEESRKEDILKYSKTPLRKAFAIFGISALIIAAAGIWLAHIGENLSDTLGLGQNFIGSLFLGFATTLPEITVSIAALRLGAKELAIANMFGSNLFNMSVFFFNDAIYRKAPIFSDLSQQHVFSAFIVIFMTIIIISGLILKPKKKIRCGFSVYSIGLITVFLFGAFINFKLGIR